MAACRISTSVALGFQPVLYAAELHIPVVEVVANPILTMLNPLIFLLPDFG